MYVTLRRVGVACWQVSVVMLDAPMMQEDDYGSFSASLDFGFIFVCVICFACAQTEFARILIVCGFNTVHVQVLKKCVVCGSCWVNAGRTHL